MTRAETLLWRYIKAHRIEGLGFRRQAALGNYVADFVCHSARLIVELDSESHDFESRQKTDRRRDAWFESQGYAVLRFTNDQVLRELEGVVHVIRETACARCAEPPSLSLPQVHVGRFRFGPINYKWPNSRTPKLGWGRELEQAARPETYGYCCGVARGISAVEHCHA